MAANDPNFGWNSNKAHATLGIAEFKKFEQRLAAHLGNGQPQVAQGPPPQIFHMGNGNFHWDVSTRYV